MILLLSITARAQHAATVKGKVYDAKHKSMEGVSIVLTESSKNTLAKTDLTAADGSYTLKSVEAGKYVLTAMLYKYGTNVSDTITVLSEDISLPDIVLNEQNKNLKEVTIHAQKPLIEIKADKIVVNVENSIVNTGSSVLEVLGRSPGVTVDQNDNISLKGRAGVNIMMDGKQMPVSGSDLANMLKSMPSSNIEKIEIISNPGARYDAAGSGGIINIKTKKEKGKGFNGSVNASYGQGIYHKANGGFNLNYRNKKLNAFISYTYSNRKGISYLGITRRFYKGDTLKTTYTQDNNLVFPMRNHIPAAGIDYALSARTTIGIGVSGTTNHFKPIGDNTSRVDSGNTSTYFTTANRSQDAWYTYTLNGYLKHTFDTLGQELSMDIDYGRYWNTTKQLYTNKYFDVNHDPALPDYLLYGDLAGLTQIRTFKTDYTLPTKQGLRLEAGFKISYTTADNNLYYGNIQANDTVYDPTRSNHFIYNENINAAYINTSKDMKKWSFQLGLRAEQTVANGNQVTTGVKFNRNYVQLFPSLASQYHLNDNNDIGLTLSRRIDRPNYHQLNPFKFFLDPTNYRAGNPYLRPCLTYAVELSYTWKQKFVTSFGYSIAKDYMVEVLQANPGQANQSYQTDENVDGVDYYSISGAYPIQVFKWWNCILNVNGYYNFFRGNFTNTSLQKSGPAFDINSTNSFTLPQNCSGELSFFYQSAQVWGFYNMKNVWGLNAGVQKHFFNKKLTAKIAASDIFRTSSPSADLRYNEFYESFVSRRDSRVLTLSLVYRFGKNAQPARRHNSGAEDEKRRAASNGT